MDAISLDIETIETADVGEKLIYADIYASFKLRNGDNLCQLIFTRIKIVHNLSIPCAELETMLLNANISHLVHTKCWKLTDSQVALHWIN